MNDLCLLTREGENAPELPTDAANKKAQRTYPRPGAVRYVASFIVYVLLLDVRVRRVFVIVCMMAYRRQI